MICRTLKEVQKRTLLFSPSNPLRKGNFETIDAFLNLIHDSDTTNLSDSMKDINLDECDNLFHDDMELLKQQIEYLNAEALEHIKSSKDKDERLTQLKLHLDLKEQDVQEQMNSKARLEELVTNLRIRNKELYDENMKSKQQQKEFEKKLENISKSKVLATPSKLIGDKGVICVRYRQHENDQKDIEENEDILKSLDELRCLQDSIQELFPLPSLDSILNDSQLQLNCI